MRLNIVVDIPIHEEAMKKDRGINPEKTTCDSWTFSQRNGVFNPGHYTFINMKQIPRIILALEPDPERGEEKCSLQALLSSHLDCEMDFLF